MIKYYFLLMISVVLFLFSVSSQSAGDAVAGQNKVLVCAGCHGSDGNSLVPNFPKIAGIGEKYITEQLRLVKSGERIIMEMAGILDQSSDQDLQDMAAYYNQKQRTIAGSKEIELIGISDSDKALALGEKVYRGGNIANGVAACTGCHSPSGNGNGPAGYPALGGQYAEYIEKQLLAYRRGERASGNNASIMQGVAANLSDKEIKAVSNYISGLN